MKTKTTTWLRVTLLGVVAFSTARMQADVTYPVVAEQWREIELVFTAETHHPNPYTEVEFHLEFEGPNGARLIRPGFWDGGKTYRVRFASPTAKGQWRWRSLATPPDAGLHGKRGTITSAANSGGDALSKHGLLRMSPGARTIVHADGTPFLMVADTPWALPWRATVNDARVYARNRQASGFNTALLMSLQPDRGENGPNERAKAQGFAVAFDDLKEGHLNQINNSYFQYFDELRDVLLAHGIVPVFQPVFHGFGWKGNKVLGWTLAADEYARYCRYLVARYGAKPAMWLVGADSTGLNVGVKEGGETIEQWDAYRQPTGLHYSPKAGNNAFQEAPWLDFQWCQTGHGGRHRTDRVRAMYANRPIKGVANGEPTYEGINQPDRAAGWWQGHGAWLQYTSGGTMGVVYGAGGLWQWKITPDEPGWPDWANSQVSWREALELEGASFVGHLGRILQGLDVTDIPTRHDLAGGKLCLAKEGKLYIVYLPEAGEVTLARLETGMRYHWYDPKTGTRLESGVVVKPDEAFKATNYPAVLVVEEAAAGSVRVEKAKEAADADDKRVVVLPVDNGQALVNPGMGWVLHYYDNLLTAFGDFDHPTNTHDYFPGLSVVYLRLAWGYIEPEKGKFNWSIVDGPAQRFIDRGWQVAFRFSCYEGHSAQHNATPAWVREAGAEGDLVEERDGNEYWQPRYDDPVYLRHLEEFLAAAARRYDGNPNVAWIDVGSFGVWGEGHTKLDYSRATRRQHVALHTKYFKKTLVAVNDDLGKERRKDNLLADLVGAEPNVTLRDDSIMVNPGLRAYRSAFLAEQFWPRHPIILESGHYSGPKRGGFWDDGNLYAESMEAYRGSYISIHWYPRQFLDENPEFVRRMNLRMGYRLHLLEASWPAHVAAKSGFNLVTKWKNAGVAPCYPGGHVAVTLKSEQAGIVTVFVDESWNHRELGVDMPGPDSKVVQYNDGGPRKEGKDSIRSMALPVPGSAPVKELQSTFAFSEMVKPGTYDVFISVGDRDGTPRIALPLKDDDGHRRYRLGRMTILN